MNLKPCPFCGGKAVVRDGFPLALIICEDEVQCGGRTMSKTRTGAVSKWNLRAQRAEEKPPGYRTGKRKLVYNKDTKQIDVVDSASGFVVDSFDPPTKDGSGGPSKP